MSLAKRFIAGALVGGTLLAICSLSPLAVAAAPAPESAAVPVPKSGITITPSQKELIVSSGLINARTDVVLTNNSGRDLDAVLRLVDFKSFNDSGGLAFSPGVSSDRYGLANWMELPNGPTVHLTNGQSTTVPVVVVNRFDLTPGGHYGAVVVTFGTDGNPVDSSKARFKQELVSLLFVKKLGGEDYALQLQSFKADSASAPKSATMRFKATGNVYVVPRGYVSVTNRDGTELARGTINPESSIVLPGVGREFTTQLQSIVDRRLTKDLRAYKITAYYRPDGQKQFMSSSLDLAHQPLLLFIAIGLLITGVSITILLRTVHHNRPS